MLFRSAFFMILLTCIGYSQTLTVEEYDPPSTLVVPEHLITHAKYPFVDVHNHQFSMPTQDLQLLARQMDSLNMAAMVNLSGRGFRRIQQPDGSFKFGLKDGEFLKESVQRAAREIPDRVLVFTNVDWEGVGSDGWLETALAHLERDVRYGAKGLKIYKNLGMDVKDSDGNRLRIDDPRIAPVWDKCAELGIPVLIHAADPAQFWQPHDANNERWYELKERPERKRIPGKDAPFETIIAEQHNIFRQHPKTIFINAHLGWYGNDLARLGKLLDECPNVYTEIGAVLAELGRQPYFARDWMIKYQDRVMFGKDSWNPEEYHVYFRVLETRDDYIKYYRRRHAFWRLYGLDLPDAVLRKLYYGNALRVVPGLNPDLFPNKGVVE
ncbi:MAG TPA: amidohydrolase family protein [Calditrichia bacterium]|nr:amidohydrolase [Calditrichota bacterium]HQV32455.1 amidohydrolase family protein [Calditrichia bacterium]